MYSQVTKITPSEEFKKKCERELKELKKRKRAERGQERAVYINFVVDKASKEVTTLKDYERFSYYLATILAKKKEVVAIWLRVSSDHCEIYLSKNFTWESQNVKYIDKIMMYLKDISKNAFAYSDRNNSAFAEAVMVYCSAKLEYRYKKLRDYIKKNGSSEHVKSFKNFF
ncbi:13127_t:CDS:2 [Funneliformis mosseae]|uniref:13127_t:CDS:1 n=1 Tax=Funneliformis mosseae TaxID=27381 RepID=A0A9N9HD62_FUNMO|nr:13127_t:CDS:2 [Funneliformis mosseae]